MAKSSNQLDQAEEIEIIDGKKKKNKKKNKNKN